MTDYDKHITILEKKKNFCNYSGAVMILVFLFLVIVRSYSLALLAVLVLVLLFVSGQSIATYVLSMENKRQNDIINKYIGKE